MSAKSTSCLCSPHNCIGRKCMHKPCTYSFFNLLTWFQHWSQCIAFSACKHSPCPWFEAGHGLSRWDEMTERWGPPLQSTSQVVETEEEVHVLQMKLLSINKSIFYSSSAVNWSLSSRKDLIASCLISSSPHLIFLQLQRFDWPLITRYPFSPLSLSDLESYSFLYSFFFLLRLSQKPTEHWPVILNLLGTSYQIIFHPMMWPSLASSFTFPNRAHESSKISPNQR